MAAHSTLLTSRIRPAERRGSLTMRIPVSRSTKVGRMRLLPLQLGFRLESRSAQFGNGGGRRVLLPPLPPSSSMRLSLFFVLAS